MKSGPTPFVGTPGHSTSASPWSLRTIQEQSSLGVPVPFAHHTSCYGDQVRKGGS